MQFSVHTYYLESIPKQGYIFKGIGIRGLKDVEHWNIRNTVECYKLLLFQASSLQLILMFGTQKHSCQSE